jgi:flagellar hook protein FlgE
MSLFGAMFSGVTGLRAQSQSLSIISDNISNLNTVGYKATVNQFSTLVTNQVTSTAYASGGVISHPKQLIDRQGLLEASESPTDIAISGGGFFVVNTNSAGGTSGLTMFTRAGSFVSDLNGNLYNTAGFFLQGWPTDANGVVLSGIDTSTTQDLQTVNTNIIKGSASATSNITIGANLPAGAATGTTENTNIVIYDSLGISHNLGLVWGKSGPNQWDIGISAPAGSAQVTLNNASGQPYAAAGRLDFSGQPADGDTVVIDGTTYEFDSGGGVGAGNTAVTIGGSVSATVGNLVSTVGDGRFTQGTGTSSNSIAIAQTAFGPAISIDASATSAITQNTAFTVPQIAGAQTANVSFSGQPADGDTIIIGGTTYEFDNNAAVGGGNTAVTIGGSLSATIANLVTAVGDPRVTQGTGANSGKILIQQSAAGTALSVDATGTSVASPAGLFTVPVYAAQAPAITFAGDGTPAAFNVSAFDIDWSTGAAASNVALNLGTVGLGDGLTQFSDVFSSNFVQQDGVPFGNYSGVSIDKNGIVSALFDNGVVRPIYQIPIATFADANALGAHTGNAYQTTTTSGNPLINFPGVGPAGKVNAGALEASTVDLAEEFTRMIVAQRAFSAASKVITTSDQMLDELTQIKR